MSWSAKQSHPKSWKRWLPIKSGGYANPIAGSPPLPNLQIKGSNLLLTFVKLLDDLLLDSSLNLSVGVECETLRSRYCQFISNIPSEALD